MTRFAPALLAAMLLFAAPAHAQTERPCALPGKLCADPELRRLDAELAVAELRFGEATNRPRDAAGFGRILRKWLLKPLDPRETEKVSSLMRVDPPARLRERKEELERLTAQAAKLARPASEAAIYALPCLSRRYTSECRMESIGTLFGADGTRILWRNDTGDDPEDNHVATVMVWDVTQPSAPVMIGWSTHGTHGVPPVWVRDEPGVLVVGGYQVFRKTGGRWRDMDTAGWQAELLEAIPAAFTERGMHKPDYRNASAESPLWRKGGAMCCPDGKLQAGLRFEGDEVTLDGADYALGGAKDRVSLHLP